MKHVDFILYVVGETTYKALTYETPQFPQYHLLQLVRQHQHKTLMNT